MVDVEYMVFDCMETLVGIDDFNITRDYAFHTYYGSGVEKHWNGFDDFYRRYLEVRDIIAGELPENKEYNRLSTYMLLCKSNREINEHDIGKIASQLLENFWKNYSGSCHVEDDVRKTLPLLEKTYRLGIVGNLTVEGGIEKLLENYSISHHFDFVISSISIGWRKPDRRIYEAVLMKTNSDPQRHLFIGDDYENDFQGPRRIGMRSLLLDRKGKYPHVEDRIESFSDLLDKCQIV